MENKTKKKKSTIVLYFLIGIISFLTVYISAQVIVGNMNHRPPRVFGLSVAYVPTNSMEPNIMPGDYVMFGVTSFESVQKDDVIVYYNPSADKSIIHRVIGMYSKNGIVVDKMTSDGYFITKGDNNMAADTIHVTKDLLIGKYIGKVDFLKVFSGGVNNYVVFFAISLLVTVFVVLQFVSVIMKYKKDKSEEKRIEEMNLLREEMKNEILKEELEKLKNNNDDK